MRSSSSFIAVAAVQNAVLPVPGGVLASFCPVNMPSVSPLRPR